MKGSGPTDAVAKMVEAAQYRFDAKVEAIECILEGTTHGSICAKLLTSLRSEYRTTLDQLHCASNRSMNILDNRERSLATRDETIRQLRSKIKHLQEEEDLMSKVRTILSLNPFCNQGLKSKYYMEAPDAHIE